MKENKAKQKLRAGESVLAITINFVHAGLAEFLGRLGYDIIIIDGEHGRIDEREVEGVAMACDLTGAVPLMRLPVNGPLMERYLGMGIAGFHAARVSNLAQTREVIDAVKFGPSGKRGIGNFRASDFGVSLGSWPAFMENANETTFIKIAIEDAEGLADLPEIVKLPEVDVILIGKMDLSTSLGVPGQPKHPKVVEAYKDAIEIIRGAGKTLGVGSVGTLADLQGHYADGARYFMTSVARTFRQAGSALLDGVKGLK